MDNLKALIESNHLQKALDYYAETEKIENYSWYNFHKDDFERVLKALNTDSAETQAAFILLTIDAIGNLRNKFGASIEDSNAYMNLCHDKEYPRAAAEIVKRMLRRKYPFTVRHYAFMLNRTADLERISNWILPYLEPMIKNTEAYLKKNELSEELDQALQRVCRALEWIGNAPERKLRDRINRMCHDAKVGGGSLISSESLSVYFNTADYWAQQTLANLQKRPSKEQQAWDRVLHYADKQTQAVPNKKWISDAKKSLENLGQPIFKEHFLNWVKDTNQLTQKGLPDDQVEQLRWAWEAINTIGFKQSFVDMEKEAEEKGEDAAFFNYIRKYCGRPELIGHYTDEHFKEMVLNLISSLRRHLVRFQDQNTDLLRGLVWFCCFYHDKEIIRALGQLCMNSFRKIPGVGPVAPKVGNACLLVLGQIASPESMAQLGILRYKLKGKAVQNTVEKTYNRLSEKLGLSQEEIDEITVPDFGMAEIGSLKKTMGEIVACVTMVDGAKTELAWIRQDGKEQKTLPASVKEQYKDEIKELKETIQDIQKTLPAQKERIQNLYLQRKVWLYPVWKERYLDHPLVGLFARRLIWRFTFNESVIDGIFYGNGIVDIHGKSLVSSLNEQSKVEMWHPIQVAPETVLAWRKRLRELEIRQPFKQAHREIYTLTDAERQTRIYSNRYAAHIVKQHQFNALCAVRGWRNTLKLMVDGDFPPASISLSAWKLRAEFWTDGIGENYGQDTNDTGTYLYLTTDQVRFFSDTAVQARGHAFDRGQAATVEPIALESIPAIVFSEVMRDIDLFIGVASVGNDPTWADSGPEGHRTYWYGYSFGELSVQAETRKEALLDIIPRLAISAQCTFEDRFLRVQGKLRAYKIHLGSGNILMEPNDQYLCIVRNQSKDIREGSGPLFLPFEGDDMLSLILSKAILLANDTKIQDATILSQIKNVKA